MNVTKITIGRLYNLGSEHIRYDVTVEVREGESAAAAMVGLERLITALAPECKWGVSSKCELDRELNRVLELKSALVLTEEEFQHKYGYGFKGTPQEYFERVEKDYLANKEKREAYLKRAKRARQLLDDMGGAEKFTDAKLSWDDGYDDEP